MKRGYVPSTQYPISDILREPTLMMTELISLGVPAVSIGFFHCVCGPDHYVPFVAMSRIGLWSLRKTLLITVLCGIGHVLSSAVIGFIGIALGLIVSQLEGFENFRGDVAAWLLFGFGLAYTAWGIYYAFQQRRQKDAADGDENPAIDSVVAVGTGGHPAAAELVQQPGQFTPWILFTIFLFGPCEPLIPMLMVPASKADMFGVAWIAVLFGLTTLVTMTAMVALIYMGAFAVRLPRLQQWGHALAGSVVTACGASILFLGL